MSSRPREARRSKRQATTRKRSLYQEVDTDDELEADSEEEFRPAQRFDQPQDSPQPPPKKRRTTKRAKPQTRSVAAKKTTQPPRKRHNIGGLRKERKDPLEAADAVKKFTGPSDRRIPAWATLPVDILRDIFIFASQPLHEQGSVQVHAAWLMKTARGVCRAFAQPALEAYYASPALYSPVHPHNLAELLRKPKAKRFMDYNVKIHSIEMTVQHLAYTAHNRSLFHLSSLITATPRLQHLEIKHPVNEPPYRQVKLQKWQYPRDLHLVLSHRDTRLRSFRWTRDMINTEGDPDDRRGSPGNTAHPGTDSKGLYDYMTGTHLSPAFQTLSSLTICGFDKSNSRPLLTDEAIPKPVQDICTTLAVLPNLRHLSFISSDLLRKPTFFASLPSNLHSLALSNCRYVNSDMLLAYLSPHGSQLRALALNHNIALDLAFLPSLRTTCPRLEQMKVDAHFYSEMYTVNDADPLYDELLLSDEIPSWPSTLRSLELTHLQKWSMEAAVNLFKSLVDSAPELPDLRHLVIQAHINIPWRDRAGFRERWIDRLHRVYLRKSEPPLAMLGSLRQWQLWSLMNKAKKPASSSTPKKAAPAKHDAAEVIEVDDESEDDAPLMRGQRKRMSAVAITPRKPSTGDTDFYSDSDDQPLSKTRPRRSTRVQITAAASAKSRSEESESENTSAAEEASPEPDLFVQGLCNVVDVKIDNQRPRENQFTEGDFLDSEVSGDEDWNEDAEGEFEEEGYAWND